MFSLFRLYGWETLCSLIRADVTKDADWIFAFVHWFLVHKGQLGCLGTTGDKIKPLLSRPHRFADSSEMLPAMWNEDESSYSLLYVLEGEPNNSYILIGQISEDVITLSILNSANKIRLSVMHMHIEETAKVIASCTGTKSAPHLAQLFIDRLMRELFNPIYGGREQTCQTQTIPFRLLILNELQNALKSRHPPEEGLVFSCEDFEHVWPEHRTDLLPLSKPAGRQGSGTLLQQPPTEVPPKEPFAPDAVDAAEGDRCAVRNEVAEKCDRVIDKFER